MAEQAGLNLTFFGAPEDRFSRDEAHIIMYFCYRVAISGFVPLLCPLPSVPSIVAFPGHTHFFVLKRPI